MNALKIPVKVATYEELVPQVGQPVLINDKPIALFKVTSGEVYAIEDKSPHPKGGVLSEGLVSGHYVFCPVYDWKISLADGLVQAPDEGKVQTYKVEVRDGDVYVSL
ncbi:MULTISPECIES: nitrite reductase small subunit NirD [Bacillaceae]|uniref:Nitrite reductase small subunit NirD n=1 Tax=Evansella alkalicola TaxID=745819 RepID=A0ABS6JMT0_9BACI|nr:MULTISPECIES: nitrite reductase small subunit NirD [Bacillaceae]MBU9719873.1 nitrite reductase small subunit NirD [Bacillus alkalicola]